MARRSARPWDWLKGVRQLTYSMDAGVGPETGASLWTCSCVRWVASGVGGHAHWMTVHADLYETKAGVHPYPGTLDVVLDHEWHVSGDAIRLEPLEYDVPLGGPREVNLDLVTLVVPDYDAAICFFVDRLGFDLAEDTPTDTNDGRPKRWVVVRPPGGQTGLLLARADGAQQTGAVGNQTGGRVSFFLRVENFEQTYETMKSAGVIFVEARRTESYGRVAVFVDPWGNRWDLLGR